jgi:hypothetical protein
LELRIWIGNLKGIQMNDERKRIGIYEEKPNSASSSTKSNQKKSKRPSSKTSSTKKSVTKKELTKKKKKKKQKGVNDVEPEPNISFFVEFNFVSLVENEIKIEKYQSNLISLDFTEVEEKDLTLISFNQNFEIGKLICNNVLRDSLDSKYLYIYIYVCI